MKTSRHFGPSFNNYVIDAAMRQNDGTFQKLNAIRFKKQ